MTWSLVDRLRQYCLTAPEETAIDLGGAHPARLTRGGWDTGARAVAAHLRPGTRVLVLLPSGADFFVAFAGALYAGACAVPAVPPVQGRAQFVDLGMDAEVDAVVTTSAIAGQARLVWERAGAPGVRWVELDRLDPAGGDAWTAPTAGPEDLSLLQYTSGSTGAPKGVAVGHRTLTTWVDVLAERVALPAGSHVVTWVPAHHVLGLSFVLMGQHLGGAVDLFTPEDVLADPARWLGAVSDASRSGRKVMSGAPPFGYQQATATVPPDGLDLSNWDAAVIGSERIRPKVLDDFAARFAPAGFRPTAWFTGYGTTEVMMGCAHHGPGEPPRIDVDAAALEHREVAPAGEGRSLELIACGPAGVDHEALIVDPDTRTPSPAVGELWLRGPGVAQGYWHRPEQTEETFGAYLADGAGPYYRTGDLAFEHEGELVICGRLSELVIIRGRNLIPQDIESSVRSADPLLARAPVAAFSVEDADGEALVVVAAVEEPPDADALAVRARRAVIAGHEVDPHALLLVAPGQISQTPTGKVRHRACRESYLDGRLTTWNRAAQQIGPAATPAGPIDTVRARIAEIVGEDPDTIPVDEPLVRLGLDSMDMIKLRAALAADLGTLVPIERLAGLTVVALAAELVDQDDHNTAAVSDRPDLTLPGWGEVRLTPVPEERHEPFPLTELQHAYLVGRSGGLPLGGVGTHFYAEHDTTGLDLDRLHAAWCRLVERHDMLRAVVSAEGEQTVQSTVDMPAFATRDLRHLDPERAAAGAEEVRDELSHQVFEPDSWPLYEIRVTRLPDGVDRLHVSFDLLVLDVWSLHLLSREWHHLYERPDADLPPLEVTFRDYVRATADAPGDEDARAYWRDRLDTLPAGPDLPLRRSPASLTEPPVFVRRHDRLDGPRWSALTELAAAEGLTPSSVLLAAYATVLGAWSRRSRFTLNLPTFNRLPLHPDLDSVIGDFTSVTLLEVDLSDVDGLAGLARRLQTQLWRDLEHRAHDGVRVLRELARHHGPDAGVLAPVVFSSASGQTTDGVAELPLNWLGEHVFGVSQTPQVVLDHQLIEVGDGLEYQWDTVDELFRAGTGDEMFAAYAELLDRLSAGEDAVWHGAPPELRPAAHRDLVAAANDTAGTLPDGLLHDRLVARALETPDRPAVLADDHELAFGELYHRAAALAADLRAGGVVPNQLVAVALPKGAAQVVAVLGVLLAGGAYLPVDPELPEARRRGLVELGGCRIVVCAKGSDWPGVVDFELDLTADVSPTDLPASPAGPDDLAYVIFTSGSTGEPKGVAVSHRAALNTCVDVNDRFEVGAEDRVLGLSSLSFDLSVWDVFGVLGAGGALVLPSTRDRREPGRWLELVRRHRVTVWNSVPALAQMYADYPREEGTDPLRLVMMSGDWIPVGLPDRLRAVAPDARIVSLGGATEAAIWSICYEIGEVDPRWESVPYGRPMRNQRFHVLNERGQECPVHVVGELYIAGAGLAAGYHGDAERTAASFVSHPATGEPLYRTGDLGRWRPDGTIEFLGREDHQVKVGGYRIELGEIESAITAHDGVGSAVVAALGDRHHRRLAACLVPATGPAEGPRSAGALNPDAVDAADRAGMIFDELERVEFKLARRGVRTDLTGAAVQLDTTADTPERASRRRYGDRPVPLADLSALLECLRSHEGAAMPKYAYASAGNTYAVQTYVHVADGRVGDLAGGTYYHDPAKHRLVPIRTGATLSRDLLFGADQHALDTAAFTLFLVADHKVIRPLYGERAARDLCLVETGLMSQLLEDTSATHHIGLCQLTVVGGVDTLREPFQLDGGHEVLHAVLGGALLRVGERPTEPDHPSADTALLDDVRAHLTARLPEYMVPAQLVTAERLPLTPTGKVDRGALEHLVAAGSESVDTGPPAGELETTIADVFKEVLGIDTIGGGVRFFDLGADSTAIVRAYRLLQAALDRKFPLTAMFEHGSVRALAAALSDGPDAGCEELLASARHRAERTRAARRRHRPSRRVPATREETA